MILHPVKSSNVREIGYDPARWELYIVFKSGPYVYFDVPRHLYADLLHTALSGESVGQFVNTFIKPAYRYQKVHRLVSELAVTVADTIHVEEAGFLCQQPEK